MNWIDPRVTLPEAGRIYLVLLEVNNTSVVGMMSPCYRTQWNEETEQYEKTEEMFWKSLYSQARTKAATFNGAMISEYRNANRPDVRPHYFLESVPSHCSVEEPIAYVLIQDIDYPAEIMKSRDVCRCGRNNKE